MQVVHVSRLLEIRAKFRTKRNRALWQNLVNSQPVDTMSATPQTQAPTRVVNLWMQRQHAANDFRLNILAHDQVPRNLLASLLEDSDEEEQYDKQQDGKSEE